MASVNNFYVCVCLCYLMCNSMTINTQILLCQCWSIFCVYIFLYTICTEHFYNVKFCFSSHSNRFETKKGIVLHGSISTSGLGYTKLYAIISEKGEHYSLKFYKMLNIVTIEFLNRETFFTT